MTGPHPIVRIPTELTDGRRWSKHQAYIVEIAVNRKPKLIATVIRIHNADQCRVLFSDFISQQHHHRIDGQAAFGFGHTGCRSFQYPPGYVFRTKQKPDIQLGIGQFFLPAMCREPVFQIIMIHRTVLLYAAESAMVIGKHQAIFGDDYSRTESSETDHSVFQRRMPGAIKLVGRHLQTQLFHRLTGFFIQIAKHPHTFIGMHRNRIE